DGWLNDIQGRHLTPQHVFAALERASSDPVQEGNCGAGTGTLCYRFKGGIGTASRVLPASLGGYTLGVLVQTNFGSREQLILRGQAIGRQLKDWPPVPSEPLPAPQAGSVMLVLATDAPLSSRQLTRLARRAPLGLARTGFTSGSGSGDYVIAFSTQTFEYPVKRASTQPLERLLTEDPILSALFQAAVEAVEESVYNALLAAETMAGRDGHTAFAIPREIR
ncbi:MAG: P1 family peptidase, partial [Anaerolineales bacterium]|nr:P1 family peptidase [Anaerolineales bacterium]